MDQDLAEDIRCPVCLEIPKKHMFQCKDGHMICGECFVPNLKACPQCRLPYGTDRIRCRVLESLLDSIKFECDYKGKGCLEKVSRDKLQDHLEKCKFREGGSTLLCRLIGFKDCNYKFTKSNFQDGLEHLQNAHKIEECAHLNDALVMKLISGHSTENSRFLLQWKDPAVDKDTPIWFLVLGAIQSEDESLFCALIQLNWAEKAESKFEGQFQIGSGTHRTPGLCWKQFPIRLESLEDYLEMAPFRTKLKYLRERYTNEDGLLVKMSLLEIPETTKSSVRYSRMMSKPPIPPRTTSALRVKEEITPALKLAACIPSNSRVSIASAISKGDQIGIEGRGNSSSMDAALMALFLYETSFNECLFQDHEASLSATNVIVNETRRVLVEEVIFPLQSFKHLPLASGAMPRLRGLMECLNLPNFRNSKIDADAFVSALFGSVLLSKDFYKIGDVAGFVFEITTELKTPPSAKVKVQNLVKENLRFSFALNVLQKVPSPGLIVKLPFIDEKPFFGKVLPNLEISLGNLIWTNPTKMLLSAVICREGDHYSVFVRTENVKYSPWIYLDSLIYPQVYMLPEFGLLLEKWEKKQAPVVDSDSDRQKYAFLLRTVYICIYVPQSQ